METAAQTLGTQAIEEPRLVSTVAEPDGGPAELECHHFSMRGYVAQQQKKDPKLRSLRIFCNQQQYDEHNNNWTPLLVAKYQRWNCSNCLGRVKNSGHRTASETVPMRQDGTNDDCSISIIRTLPYSVGSRRLFSSTGQSSQGNHADKSNVSKSVQECNSKCSSPSDNKAVTAVNVPATSSENNVPDTFFEKSVPDTKDLQGSPNNLDVPENILNDVSMDIADLPDDPQMISSKEGNGTQIPCSPKPCEVPAEDENRTVEDVLDVDCNESSVHEPISGHKGSKSSSGQKSNQVRNQGPRRVAPKRNVGSDGKKKKSKSTDLADISGLKFSQRKPKKTRLISDIINPLTKRKSSADDTEADHAKTGDICESDKSKMPLEAGKDNDTPVSNQKVCERLESEGTVQRCLTKVYLGKGKIQNVSGLHKQNIPKNKKKRRLEVDGKETVRDDNDIPMDIVELLSAKQHERQLMTDTDSTLMTDTDSTQPKIAAVDGAEIADKDGPTDASDTNFQKSLASESKQKSLHGCASSSTEAANMPLQDLHWHKSSQCHAASISAGSFSVYPHPELPMPDILECTQEQQTHICRDEEVTIACTSPIFSNQHIAEVPTQSWSKKGEKKLMWDSFKAASRNSPTSTYGFQYRNGIREVDSTPIPAYAASNDYATHQPVIAAVGQYTEEAVNQVQPTSAPSTELTLEVGGHSCLYPKEPMPATHLLRLTDSSTSQGFTNYQRANRHQMELGTGNLSSQYAQHNYYNASPSTSHGSLLTERVPLTLQDLSRHVVERNLHKPLRPHPRVGVLGSLLQQDIANWSESCGTQSAHRVGVSKGTRPFDMNRRGNCETLRSGMFSAGWNALQLGSVTSAANPEHPLPRYGASQAWAGGTGKTPLDKLVRKDICQTNRNPADFTVISDENEYMINL